jgi:serine-type D-Ala-D-Ala carboxypeptidase (penicillin-binding protein 5/6)
MRRRVVVVAAAIVAVIVVSGGLIVGIRVAAAPPSPTISIHATGTPSAGTTPTTVPLPIHGSLVITATGKDLIGGTATVVADNPDAVQPIASVAKTLTALTVLTKKPLATTDAGPVYTITPQDVTYYTSSVAAGGSSTLVAVGEQFSERQLLEALMLPSGNNIADTLALWVGGSLPAFMAMERTEAAALGMTQTTITDPSGFDSGTRSTATDLVKLGTASIANSALASVIAEHNAKLPDGQSVANFDTALTEPGWLGIKTGDSTTAGGCFLFAVQRKPAGTTNSNDAVTLVGAVVGERSAIANASGDDDRGAAIYDAVNAVDAVMKGYVPVNASVVTDKPALSGAVATAWGNDSSLELGSPVAVSSAVVRSGTTLSVRSRISKVDLSLAAGTQVGTVEGLVNDKVVLTWPVITVQAVDGPGFLWRLEHD